MRWKKWAIGVGTTVAVVVPAALLITVAATPRPPLASNRYLLNLVSDQELQKYIDHPEEFNKLDPDKKRLYSGQRYVNQSIELVNKVLDAYKTYEKKDPYWNLNFTTLNGAPTNDELNFYQELTRSILAISNGRINFTLIPRTPSSVNQGFNNKNQQMVTWYWSPDYDGLGTWLGYNFSPDFLAPNMWPWLCANLQMAQNSSSTVTKTSSTTWQESLAEYLANTQVSTFYYDGDGAIKPITFKIGQICNATKKIDSITKLSTVDIPHFQRNEPSLVPSLSEMYDFVTKFKIKGTGDIYSAIQNGISAWSMEKDNNNSAFVGDEFAPGNTTYLVNTLNTNPTFIPFIGDGPNSKNPKLVRYGANAPDNPKTYVNNRDWFLQATDEAGTSWPFNKDVFSWQGKSDPFAQNLTAWNPCFAENTSLVGKSVFTNLFTWTTVNNPTDTIIDSELVAEGTTSENDFAKRVDNVINFLQNNDLSKLTGPVTADMVQKIEDTNVYTLKNPPTELGEIKDNLVYIKSDNGYLPRWKFDFKIRPIPWVDTNGNQVEVNGKKEVLSPKDFLAGWKGYKLAVDGGMSHNDYFIGMLGLDMDETIKYGEKIIEKEDKKSGLSYSNDDANIQDESTWNEFSIFLNTPILPGQTCKDILTNQYFAAIPYDNPKVQNIIDENNKKIVRNDGLINKTATFAGNNIYGSGLATESYKDLWSAAPYYVSDCNQSSFTFSLNHGYFKSFELDFKKNTSTSGQLNPYLQFNEETPAPFGKDGKPVMIKKIQKVVCSYLGYNIKTTYDQFKNGSRDMAEIPSNEMAALGTPVGDNDGASNETNNSLLKDVYSPMVSQENKTNLTPYNTNVFLTTTTKQGIPVMQAQLNPKVTPTKGIVTTDWGLIPSETDKYGNTTKWKAIPIDPNNSPSVPPGPDDLIPILKDNIPEQYNDLIVKNFNTNVKDMSELIDVFLKHDGVGTIDGVQINDPSAILNYSSTIIRSTINNAINWIDMAEICFPNNNKSPQLSFTPYGVFNTNYQDQNNVDFKYYNLAWTKPGQNTEKIWSNVDTVENGVKKIAQRYGGILKFTNDEYEAASSHPSTNIQSNKKIAETNMIIDNKKA